MTSDFLNQWRLRAAAWGSSRRASRDPHWDNIRYFSGTLVVFVHMTTLIQDHAELRGLYIATWAMRVPVFVLVAGYFSRADSITPREARRMIESIVVPYIAIGLLHTWQMGRNSQGGWNFHTIEPAWGMWFLLSLLCWRAALPYLAQLRYPLASAVAVSLVAGYVSEFGTTASFARTFGFLPFFVLGWKIREGLFSGMLRARWSRDTAWAVIAAAFVAGYFLRDDLMLNWLRMKGPYASERDVFGGEWAWTVRGMILLGGMAVALSLVRLIPSRRLPVITYLGAGGLYIYLLHPLVLRPLHERDLFEWADTVPEAMGTLLLSALLGVALACAPMRWLTRPVIQPRLPWLFTAEANAAAGPGGGAAGAAARAPKDGPPPPVGEARAAATSEAEAGAGADTRTTAVVGAGTGAGVEAERALPVPRPPEAEPERAASR